MTSKSKVAAMVAGLAIATSVLALAPVASAASLTSAQVQSILTMISAFGADSATIANVNAALTGSSVSGSTTTTTSACTFSSNLTIGSTGAAVTCLQNALIANGYAISAGATGYFGAQTQSAVAKWQAAAGVSPAAGYFGSISRAAFNLGGSSSTNTTTTTTTTNNTTTTTSTPGAEGSFTVVQSVYPANNTNVTTNTDTPVYGIKIKATGSNMIIDRADLEMDVTVNGSAVNPSGFVTSISAWDGSTLLKTMPLTSADFNKDSSSRYYIRMTGIGFSVPKDVEKNLTFKINTNSVGSSDYTRAFHIEGWTGSTQNVRGTDGAGLSSYGDANWDSDFTFTASNNATLTGTLNSATPKAQTIATTTDGISGVVMQTVDLKSTLGVSTLTDMLVTVGTSVATAKPTAVYLYDGSTLLGSAAPVTVTAGSSYTATFSNMSLDIAKDATKTLTVKADFPVTAVGVASSSITTTAATTAYETPDGTAKSVTISSAMVGNDVHIYGTLVPVWTLVSASITPTAGVVDVSSSTLTGTIKLRVTANGGSIVKPIAGNFSVYFASSTPSTRTTNGGAGYTLVNAIATSSQSVTVSPSDATLGNGSYYDVTIVGQLISSQLTYGAAVGSGYNEFMAVDNITTDMAGTSGDITGQTWGIDTFYTPSALLPKASK